VAQKTEATITFYCPHLQYARTNLHDFLAYFSLQCCFVLNTSANFILIVFITKSDATWRKLASNLISLSTNATGISAYDMEQNQSGVQTGSAPYRMLNSGEVAE